MNAVEKNPAQAGAFVINQSLSPICEPGRALFCAIGTDIAVAIWRQTSAAAIDPGNGETTKGEMVDAPIRRLLSSSVILRFELGKFFFGVSDVGFLSDAELKKLLLPA